MQIQLSGRQVEITPPLREYVGNKLERVIRHFEGVQDAHVIMSVEKLKHRVEATLNARRNKVLHADAEADDMYAAIDALVDKLDRQVRKHKEKITDHHRADARRGVAN
jgi:putative sigma-54 modulation protein